MAEGQVSADGKIYKLPDPFMVIATQNSMESHGVFPLPDSQLDRFLIKMSLGLPTAEQELEILTRTERGMQQANVVLTIDDVKDMQDYGIHVDVSVPVKQYMVRLSRATREHTYISSGVSPRGTVLLQRASQAWAAMESRTYVVPEDVKQVAPMVLPHRMAIRAAGQVDGETLIREVLETVDVPL
jgi:MoxR-like ATPase